MRMRVSPFDPGRPGPSRTFCQSKGAFATPYSPLPAVHFRHFSGPREPAGLEHRSLLTCWVLMRFGHQRAAASLAAAPIEATKMVTVLDRRIWLGASLVAMIGIAGWVFMPSFAKTPEPDLTLNLAVADPAADSATIDAQPAKLTTSPEKVDLDRVSLSRQSFRRGGMGSRALMTFTVRNANAYDIKDLELLCAFKSRDGRYTTERRKLVAETVAMKSRKAFPMTLVGHVNVRASKAKCSLLTASRA
jgi:hypothetical protein